MARESKFYDLLGVCIHVFLRSISGSLYPTNYFEVSPSATDQELKSAYKRGALKHHPGILPTVCTQWASLI